MRASSQRRSAALLCHSSALQCTLGNLRLMSCSVPPRATPFASKAAKAGVDARQSSKARLASRIQLPPAKAAFLMVVHHPGRLHESVHDSRADEVEAALPEVFRQFRRIGKPPDIAGEAA